VDSGDGLSNIAKQELGDANRWREIYDLNKDVIGENPDLIQPGMELKLPD
jgi:nucleoid-associated protein YgaU